MDLRFGGAQIGALLIDELLSCSEGLQQSFVTPQIPFDLVARRFGVGEARLGLADFGRLAASSKIGELLLSLLELTLRLVTGGPVGGGGLGETPRPPPRL